MTGPSMTLADRLQELMDRQSVSSMAMSSTLTLGTWLGLHSAEIVAALRDRDRLREAADALLAGYDAFVRAFDAGLGPSHPADYMGQDADDLRPLLSQPSPSSEEAPAP